MKEVDTQADLLASCRNAYIIEGKGSYTAWTLFNKFHHKWFEKVEGWSRAKVGISFSDIIASRTFEKAWQWICSSYDLPEEIVLLRRCHKFAEAEILREHYGRNVSIRDDEDLETVIRRPLSLDWPDEQTQTLIDKVADSVDVEAEVLRMDEMRLLRKALSRLPDHYRACIICRYLRELTVAETVAGLGLPVDKVKQYTGRGLIKLRLLLEEAANE